MQTAPVTVVETREFQREAARLYAPDEVERIVEYVTYHPTAGVVMPGTNGVRKLRWAAGGKGRRGGARVVFFYHSERMPVFLFTVYAKGAKSDLTPTERGELRRIVAALVRAYEPEEV